MGDSVDWEKLEIRTDQAEGFTVDDLRRALIGVERKLPVTLLAGKRSTEVELHIGILKFDGEVQGPVLLAIMPKVQENQDEER